MESFKPTPHSKPHSVSCSTKYYDGFLSVPVIAALCTSGSLVGVCVLCIFSELLPEHESWIVLKHEVETGTTLHSDKLMPNIRAE